MDIDKTYFLEVSSGNVDVMLELIQIFEEQVPVFIYEMKNALEKKEYKQIAAAVHKAKSSVAVFGMKTWEQKFKEIQLDILENRVPENLQTEILQFEQDAYETIKYYKEFVKQYE